MHSAQPKKTRIKASENSLSETIFITQTLSHLFHSLNFRLIFFHRKLLKIFIFCFKSKRKEVFSFFSARSSEYLYERWAVSGSKNKKKKVAKSFCKLEIWWGNIRKSWYSRLRWKSDSYCEIFKSSLEIQWKTSRVKCRDKHK